MRGVVVRDIARADSGVAAALGEQGVATDELKARVESIRLCAGSMMNLGDVAERTVPKMVLAAAPREGGAISTRSFIPHRCHASIGVFGAVSVATACLLPGSVTDGLAVVAAGARKRLAVEHPTGEFTLELETAERDGRGVLTSGGLLRTARLLFDGTVNIPRRLG